MAEGQRLTVADVVSQVRDGRLEDRVREAVELVARELMEAEVSGKVGAGLGELAPEARVTHRNGYRPRPWETRVGEIELMIPRTRSGSYFPSFLEPRRRSEQAITAVVMEAYVNGVSTRKVDRLVEQLGIEGMTKDRVSAICKGLDEQVDLFRHRPLEGAYPYLWLDAKHVKVRDHGRVVSKALVVAYAVHESGVREVIGLDIGEVETGSFWVEFLRGLKKRGLSGVRLAISDQHEGLKHAIARVLGCAWQRCTVRFVRDMLAHCRRDQRGLVSAALRKVFNAQDAADARDRAGHLLERLTPIAPKVCTLLEGAEEDLTAFYQLPAEHRTKLRSTNPLERVNKEIGRRAALRAERRVARPTAVSLGRVDDPDPRRDLRSRGHARTTRPPQGGCCPQRGLRRHPLTDELGALHHINRLDSVVFIRKKNLSTGGGAGIVPTERMGRPLQSGPFSPFRRGANGDRGDSSGWCGAVSTIEMEL
jgi:putative transposase